jgi:transposase InsO family protein
MKADGIRGIRPTNTRASRTSDSDQLAENVLARGFSIEEIKKLDRVWAGDITYLATHEGWLYLAVVLDLASRRVIGWSMRNIADRNLSIEALKVAINSRQPSGDTLFHSDRGSQYTCDNFQEVLKTNKIRSSMSRSGECWDNACVESFFGSMKREIGTSMWRTRADARAAVFEYIEVWYNRKRRHSTLGYVSPEEFESLLPIAV